MTPALQGCCENETRVSNVDEALRPKKNNSYY